MPCHLEYLKRPAAAKKKTIISYLLKCQGIFWAFAKISSIYNMGGLKPILAVQGGTVKWGYKGQHDYKGQILGKSSEGPGWYSESEARNWIIWYETPIVDTSMPYGHFHYTIFFYFNAKSFLKIGKFSRNLQPCKTSFIEK